MRVLCVNAGSSSIKVALYEVDEQQVSSSDATSSSSSSSSSASEPKLITSKTLREDEDPSTTIQRFVEQQEIEEAAHASAGAPVHPHPIRLVVHRIVHGGNLFSHPTPLDAAMLKRLETLNTLAPLHNPPAIKWIRACEDAFNSDAGSSPSSAKSSPRKNRSRPGSASSSAAAPAAASSCPMTPPTKQSPVRQIGVFDTAFFSSLPTESTAYALPASLLHKHSIRKYGFHGIAHEDMLRVVSMLDDRSGMKEGGRLITMQLGSGASIAAINEGKPIDTSMGFTPLDGLVMSTRCGDIDAGIVTFLQTHDSTYNNPDKLERMLYNESGLLGLTGGWSKDMKSIEERALSGDPSLPHYKSACIALDVFIHRLLKHIGGYIALMGGIDSLAFGGGIGEHSAEVRQRVINKLKSFLPVELDAHANTHASTKGGKHVLISSPASKIKIWVVAVDESALMLRDALKLIQPVGRQSAL